MQRSYDVVFVGSGVSSTYTLIHYADSLRQRVRCRESRVLVVEKSGDFWTGVAYGSRSGIGSLIISPLKEFLPPGELERFTGWLDLNRDHVFDEFRLRGGCLAQRWLDKNSAAIRTGDWENLYIPRHVFGDFLANRAKSAIAEASGRGLLSCDLLTAEVLSVQKLRDSYFVQARTADDAELRIETAKVILAVGSPPKRQLAAPADSVAGACLIADSHDPCLDETTRRLLTTFQSLPATVPRNVLLVGSNASALEVVYNLFSNSTLAEELDTVYVISPSGAPDHWTEARNKSTERGFEPRYIRTLAPDYRARDIYQAVQQDVALAKSQGFTRGDTVATISALLMSLVDGLSQAEQRKFVTTYGEAIGRIQRRAGGEYSELATRLISEGRIEFIAGKFIRAAAGDKGGISFWYCDDRPPGDRRPLAECSISDEKEQHPAQLAAVINCTGFQDLGETSSTLIQSLMASGVCVPTGSRRGFSVNEEFECAEGLYLIGPLLAGNLNRRLRVWHAESCSRLFQYSLNLGSILGGLSIGG
ncbi:FAD/NAD(P)-binding protein [Saxibacter everestensis]|uniref:FAD/NAD(P)-binding protein n=1 Tax=Saxibacter everestensis TaxID=2909229 RepID=A0ABY8QRS9_9MICO|nr:FAD/NAD(P)-binding protein [Brevibacteriaceae bacterium ZFBP1038]